MLDRLAVAPEALHAKRCNPPTLKFREHLLLEATKGCIKTVERHLDGVECTHAAEATIEANSRWTL
jgi:hypothetical protein